MNNKSAFFQMLTRTTILVLLLSFSSVFASNSDMEVLESGKAYCFSIKSEVDSIGSIHNINGNELLSIIYPETCRFSELQNNIEASALSYFYINFGKESSDFSIGHFQMKPSFVEDLENYIITNKANFSSFNNLLIDSTLSLKEQRKERFIRLSSQSWQIQYLSCFYKIVSKKTAGLSFNSKSDKVAFFAKYYNAGINKSRAEIKSLLQNEQKFTVINSWSAQEFQYSQLSVSFYKSLIL